MIRRETVYFIFYYSEYYKELQYRRFKETDEKGKFYQDELSFSYPYKKLPSIKKLFWMLLNKEIEKTTRDKILLINENIIKIREEEIIRKPHIRLVVDYDNEKHTITCVKREINIKG